MAQKRMFDKAIIDMDKFIDMPVSSKAMYFLLGMDADDEGFVNHKKILRLHGGTEDDIKVLAAKNFVIEFPTGVLVIRDFFTNNYLDKNRRKPTEYQAEKGKLLLTESGKYELNAGLTRGEEKRREDTREQSSQEIVEVRAEKPQKNKRVDEHILEVFSCFGKYPKAWLTNRSQRKAAENLFEERGLEQVKKAVSLYLENREDKFCPAVNTPWDLDNKWGALVRFKNKNNL